MMANPINGSGVPKCVRALAEILLREKRQFATAGTSLKIRRWTTSSPRAATPGIVSAFYGVLVLALAVLFWQSIDSARDVRTDIQRRSRGETSRIALDRRFQSVDRQCLGIPQISECADFL